MATNKIESYCPCGKSFMVWPYLYKLGKGKYCTKPCMYKFRKRPGGLTYKVTLNAGWFKEGHIPLNKGTPLTLEQKKNLSQKLKGIRCSPATEFKKGQNSGSKNHNWKGGVTPLNEKIRQSSEYRKWRTSVYERDDYTCQMCKQRGVRLNADHIKPFSKFPELRLDLDNGRTLCVDCHKKTPTYGAGSR